HRNPLRVQLDRLELRDPPLQVLDPPPVLLQHPRDVVVTRDRVGDHQQSTQSSGVEPRKLVGYSSTITCAVTRSTPSCGADTDSRPILGVTVPNCGRSGPPRMIQFGASRSMLIASPGRRSSMLSVRPPAACP